MNDISVEGAPHSVAVDALQKAGNVVRLVSLSEINLSKQKKNKTKIEGKSSYLLENIIAFYIYLNIVIYLTESSKGA